MENYNQIKITTNNQNSETVTAIMTAMDFTGGLMIEDYSDIEACKWDYVDEDLIKKDKNIVSISGFMPESENIVPIMENLKLLLPKSAKIDIISIAQSDWANNWKKYYKPIRVGKNIVIKPSWENYDKKSNDVIVELDPGMAFGTGTHETTRMCMAQLEKYINSSTNVLDVGCGSGILSITSLLLGANSATGVDIDPVATEVAVQNGERNGFTQPKYTVKQGNLVDEIDGKYDVVVANIIADIIILLCPDVKKFISENGVFICSGIIDDRVCDVENALNENGFNIIEKQKEGEWFAIVCELKK